MLLENVSKFYKTFVNMLCNGLLYVIINFKCRRWFKENYLKNGKNIMGEGGKHTPEHLNKVHRSLDNSQKDTLIGIMIEDYLIENNSSLEGHEILSRQIYQFVLDKVMKGDEKFIEYITSIAFIDLIREIKERLLTAVVATIIMVGVYLLFNAPMTILFIFIGLVFFRPLLSFIKFLVLLYSYVVNLKSPNGSFEPNVDERDSAFIIMSNVLDDEKFISLFDGDDELSVYVKSLINDKESLNFIKTLVFINSKIILSLYKNFDNILTKYSGKV